MTRHFFAGLASLVCAAASPSIAAEVSAARLLPETVVLYAETASGQALLGPALEHPFRRRIESLPQYRQWLESDDRRNQMLGLALVELQLGVNWRQAVEQLTRGGVHFAVDAPTRGVAVLLRADEPSFLEKTRDTLVRLARADAAEKGRPDPLQETTYRGVTAFRAGELRFAAVKQWLVLSNSDALGKSILDRALGDVSQSLADNSQFRDAYASRDEKGIAWAYADLEALRAAGVADPLLGGKAKDPGAELLAGGLLNTLHHAPFAIGQLAARDGSLELSFAMPHDPAWTPPERIYFFGPDHRGAAPQEIGLPSTLVEADVHRGVSGMWLHAPELFNEGANASLAKANSDLSTIFGGRPFAEEILGALDGGLRFVVVQRDIKPSHAASPAVRLPGFAAVGRLKDPTGVQRSWRIAFQTAIGFINLTGVQEGRPPLEIQTERRDGVVVMSGTYASEEGQDAAELPAEMIANAGTWLNFSPTIGFAGDSVVLSSTRTLADQLLERLSAIPDQQVASAAAVGAPSDEVANSVIRLRAAPVRAVLLENRDRLIAQNMLEKGHDRTAAERELDALFDLLHLFKEGRVTLATSADRLNLRIQLTPTDEPTDEQLK